MDNHELQRHDRAESAGGAAVGGTGREGTAVFVLICINAVRVQGAHLVLEVIVVPTLMNGSRFTASSVWRTTNIEQAAA
jgi:hypothetical protein